MKQLTLFCFIIFSQFCFSSNIDKPDLKDFFILLEKLEYKKADSIITKLSDSNLHFSLKTMCQVLYHSGQNRVIDSIKVSELKSSEDNTYISAINDLTLGYYYLYNDPESQNSFNSFFRAKQKIDALSDIHFKKICLLALLQLYSKEIVQSNEQYKIYLDEFIELSNSNIDEFWKLYYSNYFYSTSIFTPIEAFYKSSKQLINYLDSIKTNSPIKSYLYKDIGLYFKTLKDSEKAIFHYLKAIEHAQNLPFLQYVRFNSYLDLAEIESKNKNYTKAKNYLNQASKHYNKSDKLKSKFIHERYGIADFYKNIGKYDSAYYHLENSTIIEAKIGYKKNTLRISELEVELGTAEKEKENLILSEQKTKNRNIAFALAGLVLFSSITFLLIQKNTKRKQLLAEQEKELETQKLTTVLKEQELTSIDAMIKGQEKERQRIANDLHDDLGGLMTTVKWHFNSLKENKSPELYNTTTKLIDEAYNKIRSIAHSKNSGVLAKKGLLKAINDMAKTISESNKLNIEVIDHGLDNRLENSLELTIFRVIQELITNIIKHAKATEATIHITNHDDSLNIMVEDNGKGFNIKTITKSSGMGIHSIEKRIENLGGTVTIESKINKGTTIIIDIPS